MDKAFTKITTLEGIRDDRGTDGSLWFKIDGQWIAVAGGGLTPHPVSDPYALIGFSPWEEKSFIGKQIEIVEPAANSGQQGAITLLK